MNNKRHINAEVVVDFVNGYSWRSGSFDPDFAAGSYVRACNPDGVEIAYWTSDQWERHPRTVMKEIIEAVMDNPNYFGVTLADGCQINSGADLSTPGNDLGEFIQINDPDGEEIGYWDKSEWQEDPVLVMGAIMRSASGIRLSAKDDECPNLFDWPDGWPHDWPYEKVTQVATKSDNYDDTIHNCVLEFPDAELEKIPEEFKKRLVNPYCANPGRIELQFVGYGGEDIKDTFAPLIDAGVSFYGRSYMAGAEGQLPEKFINFNGQIASTTWEEWTGDLLAKYDETTGQFDPDGSTQNFIALKKQWYDFWKEFEADQETGSGPGM